MEICVHLVYWTHRICANHYRFSAQGRKMRWVALSKSYLAVLISKVEADSNCLSFSLPTCGQAEAKVTAAPKGITHCYYYTICIISDSLAPQHACFSLALPHSSCPSASRSLFCSTSIRVVLDCRVSARCIFWLRGASRTLSHSPVETE